MERELRAERTPTFVIPSWVVYDAPMRTQLFWLAAGVTVACSATENNVDPQPDNVTSTASSSTSSGQGGGATTSSGQGGAATTGQGGAATTTGAGGSEQGPPAGWESGSRLRARYYDGGDGSRAYVGFYDTALQVNCSPLKATDGVTRCLPASASVAKLYSDPSCSAPILGFIGTCSAPPSMVSLTDTSSSNCGAADYSLEVWAVGAPYTGPVYLQSSSCLDITASAPSSYTIYQASLEPPSSFVVMTEGVDS